MSGHHHHHNFQVTANMDWCEENFAITPYIAEFFNTLSSVPVAMFGLHGFLHIIRTHSFSDLQFHSFEDLYSFVFSNGNNNNNNSQRRSATSLGLLNALLHFMCMIVGLGSIWFHGFLTSAGQASDELPMLWVSSLCLFAIHRILIMGRETTRRNYVQNKNILERILNESRYFGGVLLVVNLVITYAYFQQGFILFFVTYSLTVAAMLILSIIYVRREEQKGNFDYKTSMKHRAILVTAMVVYVGGFLLLWTPEMIFCGNRKHTQHKTIFTKLHFHAFFHLTSAVGSYAFCVFAAYAENILRVRMMNDKSSSENGGEMKKNDDDDQHHHHHTVEIVNSSSWSSLYVPLPQVVVVKDKTK